jgi:cobalt-zinc-cadmium efflux system membrane fusion protein
MKRGAPLLLLILVACHRSPAVEKASAPPGEVWISPGQSTADLDTVPVEGREIGAIRTSGRIALDDVHVAHVSSPVDGRLVSASVEVGQHVKKGDALASIDSPEGRRALGEAHHAETELAAADHEFKRQKDLCRRECPSSEVEAVEDRWRMAKANLDRSLAKVRLLSSAGLLDAPFVLRAPIDGEVLARNIDSATVYNARELFTIGDHAQLWALADVSGADLGRIGAGQKVTARLPAHPDKTFEGKVDWVSATAYPVTGLGRVRCTLPNPTGELQPEMDATLTIVTAEKRLAVPRSAVVRQGEQTVVFVRAGEGPGRTLRFERRAVEVDEATSDGWVAVQAGVAEGEQVVRSGAVLSPPSDDHQGSAQRNPR